MLRHGIISVCALALVMVNAALIRDPNSHDKSVYYRLPNHTRPLLYNLKLNPHLAPDDFKFDGEMLVDLEILSGTSSLTLHSRNLMIDENATFLCVKNGFDFYVPVVHDRNDLAESLSLRFDEELPIGYYMLYLKFAGALNDRPYGFYRSSYVDEAGDRVWFAGTNFLATHARAAFPCWDEPALKATFKITIKHRAKDGWRSISNMPVTQVSEIDPHDGKVWTHFAESPVMSTYLLGFLVSDFRNVSNRDGSVNVWTRPGAISLAGFAHEVAQRAATELERYTNGTVRMPKIDHVALPGLSNKPVECWGLVTYREATMLYNEDSNPMETLYKIVDSVIFQSTHQWFGNAVTPSWWTNAWMNGGLAEYLKYHVIDKMYENWQFKQFFLTRMLNLMLFIDSFDNTQPLNLQPNNVEQIDSKFYPYYGSRKASLLLRMLSHCVTEDVFHAGLVKYLDRHKYSVVEPDDLWSALQDALDESTVRPGNKFRIREVMDTWIGQKGHPLVTVTKDQTGRTTFTQEYFRPYEKFGARRNTSYAIADSRWWIPISYVTRTNPDFSSTLPAAWLSPDVDELVITNTSTSSHDWIIVNVQHMGFYRVNYDTTNWLRIADYLDSEDYTRVHALNRVQIVNDAIYLMFAGKLDPGVFMNVTRYLRRETDCTVWYPLFQILEDAIKFYAYSDGGELLKPYVLDSMNKIVESLGVRDRPGDDYLTKITRHGILEKACASDHPACLREAHAQLIVYLGNPAGFTNSTSFHKKQWIFCNGVKTANESVWYELLRLYTEYSEPTLNCLGYSKNLTIIENLLNMIVSGSSLIPRKNIYRVFNSILNGDYPNIDVAIDFTANHWDKFTAIYGLEDATDLLYHISWNVISRKQISKIKTLMNKFNLDIPDAMITREKNLDLTDTIINKIRLWLEWRNSSLSSESKEPNPYRLPVHVVPVHYDVKLVPHIVENDFTVDGETSVDLQVRETTRTIALHTVNITVDETWTKLRRETENASQVHVPEQHRYDVETQILTVRFGEALTPGNYTLHTRFAGVLADNFRGFYKSFYIGDNGNKVWLAMTHFQPVAARQAFPCWDEPAMKATFRFSVKHYPNYTALSNMPCTGQTGVDGLDGKVWTRFATTPAMSTNVLGLAVLADYDHVSNPEGTVRVWAPKRLLRYAPSRLEIAEEAMRQLEWYLNSTVRVPKMDHVTSPQYTSRATENWGMIVYRDNVLLEDEKERSPILRMYDLMTITHELAHQWFGNLVSPAWWQFLWLSEGTSMYLKYLITEKFVKEWRIMDSFAVHILQHTLTLDSGKAKPVNVNITSHLDVRQAYSSNTYAKASIMLHMLANVLTQDVFRNGLIRYLEAHEYGVVTPDDLWEALQDAVDESNVPHDDFKVKEVMDTWFEQAGYPIVTIERDYATGEIQATQKRFWYPEFNRTEESNETWWIPINFVTRSNLDYSSTLPTGWLKPRDESLTIEGVDVNDWIILNKQLTGYYRVNYDTTNWKRIAAFLNSDDYEKIACLNRAQIVNDAFYVTASKQLDIVTYLEIVNYLWREVDPVVWIPVFKIIDEFDDFLRLSAISRRYIFGLMHKLRERIGLDDRPDDDPMTAIIRSKLFRYTCTYGDPECRAKATTKLLAYLEDPIANKIPHDSRFSIVCFALMTANESVWNQLRQVVNQADDNFVGCSTNLDILEKQLNSSVNDYHSLFSHMLKDPSNGDKAIDLFVDNFDRISSTATNKDGHMAVLRLIVAQSSTEAQLQKMKAFAEQRGIDVSRSLTRREKIMASVRSILLEIHSALETNQFAVTMHFTDDDVLSMD